MARHFFAGHISRSIADLVGCKGRVDGAPHRRVRRRQLALEGLESRALLSASWETGAGQAVGMPQSWN